MYRTTSFNDSGVQTQGIYQFIPPDLRRMFYKNPAHPHAINNGLDPYGFSTEGLVLYLPLWALKDSAFKSVDAYKHTCTVTGALWRPYGRLFSGAAQYIDLGTNTALRLISGADTIGTVLIWVYPDTTDENESPFGTTAGTNQRFYINTAVGKWATGAGAEGNQDSGLAVSATTWQLVSVVWDGTNCTLSKDKTTGAANAYADFNVAGDPNLGGLTAAGFYLAGRIGEAWMYNRALSTGERDHIYNSTVWRYQ